MAEPYTLFIVDDEPLVRKGLRHVFNKISDFKIIGEAQTGKDILKQLHELDSKAIPDVIIMDVMMPEMDGISALQLIKKSFPDIIVIILSGHDDFSYAKSAVTYHAEDYLLKPINLDNLKNLMLDIKQKIRTESQRKYEIQELKKEVIRKNQVEEDNFYRKILRNELQQHDIHNYCLSQGISYNNFFIMLISSDDGYKMHFKDAKKFDQFLYKVQTVIEEMLFNTFSIKFPAIRDANELVFFFPLTKEHSEVQFALKLKREIHLKYKETCSIAIGISVELSDIQKSYQSARKRLAYRLFKGSYSIFDQDIIGLNEPSVLAVNMLKEITRNIKVGEFSSVIKSIDTIYEHFQNTQVDPEMLYSFSYRIIAESWKAASDIFPELNNWFSSLQLSNELMTMTIIEDIKEWIKQALGELFERLSGVNIVSSQVRNALKYISEHYFESITLTAVASEVNLSAPYLSTILKKETNKSFLEHTLDFRIVEAKRLLKNPQLNISEVAWKLGYENPRYFSEVFKKYTKSTPTAYRKKYT